MLLFNSRWRHAELVAPDWLQVVFGLIFHGNLFIAAAAVTLAAATFWHLGEPLDYHLIGFIFCATLFSYTLARSFPLLPLFDAESLTGWYCDHRQLVLWLLGLSALLTVLLVLGLPGTDWLLLLHLGVISVGYAWPLSGGNLRAVPCLKIVLIGYCWAAVSVWLVAWHLGHDLSEPLLQVLFADRLLFIIAITLAFDLRDLRCDRLQKLLTLPLLLGVTRAKGVALLLLLLLVPLLGYELQSWGQQLFAGGVLLLAGWLVLNAGERRSAYYYLGLVDGLIFLHASSPLW